MKVRAKTAFFDGGKLRTRGDEFETKSFDPILMDPIEEPVKEVLAPAEPETEAPAEPKKETKTKKTSKKKE